MGQQAMRERLETTTSSRQRTRLAARRDHGSRMTATRKSLKMMRGLLGGPTQPSA